MTLLTTNSCTYYLRDMPLRVLPLCCSRLPLICSLVTGGFLPLLISGGSVSNWSRRAPYNQVTVSKSLKAFAKTGVYGGAATEKEITTTYSMHLIV